MSREINFRGKDMDGIWRYGYYVPTNNNKAFIVQMNCFGDLLKSDTHEVRPETVGQCTGLKDKNGKEIFEGEIINYQTWYGEDCSRKNGRGTVAFHCGYYGASRSDLKRLCWRSPI